jgi:hypothetical protein
MKFKNTLLAVAAQLLLVGGAYAQNCVPSAGALSDSTHTHVVDTCNSTDQLASICNSSTPIGAARDTIYSVQIGNGATGSIVVTPPFDAYVALLQGTCTGGATCSREADSNGVGGSESISAIGLSPGPYFLLITSFNGADCGNTNVMLTPTMPVSLQQFSVN